jgi:hypothetical protein
MAAASIHSLSTRTRSKGVAFKPIREAERYVYCSAS